MKRMRAWKLLHEIAAATNTGELTLIIKELSKLDSSLKMGGAAENFI